MATTKYRGVSLRDGTTLQSSVTLDMEDYRDQAMNQLFLGVILDVIPSDADKNRSAFQTTDRKGYRHECTVFIVDDGQDGYLVLDNVAITPDAPIGLDDYQEKLPRGCSNLVDGEEFDINFAEVDPYDLDGDWCVIGFLGGRIDSPFVVRWWPHARNPFDPATSGIASNEASLVQVGRYFRRINGVETVINARGDIVVSTTLSGTALNLGGDPTRGRFSRIENPEVGGSVRINIKQSQTLELDFNPQQDGIGVLDAPDPSLPQTNPPQVDPEAEETGELPESTYMYISKDQADLYVPVSATIVSQDFILAKATNYVSVSTEDFIDLTATNKITFEAEKLYLGQAAEDSEEDPVLLGEKHRAWLRDDCLVLSPFGPLKLDPVPLLTPYDATQSVKSFVE